MRPSIFYRSRYLCIYVASTSVLTVVDSSCCSVVRWAPRLGRRWRTHTSAHAYAHVCVCRYMYIRWSSFGQTKEKSASEVAAAAAAAATAQVRVCVRALMPASVPAPAAGACACADVCVDTSAIRRSYRASWSARAAVRGSKNHHGAFNMSSDDRNDSRHHNIILVFSI